MGYTLSRDPPPSPKVRIATLHINGMHAAHISTGLFTLRNAFRAQATAGQPGADRLVAETEQVLAELEAQINKQYPSGGGWAFAVSRETDGESK